VLTIFIIFVRQFCCSLDRASRTAILSADQAMLPIKQWLAAPQSRNGRLPPVYAI
jgi:hypothetical protein